MMNGSEHQVLVIGAAGLDMKVWPLSPALESGRSNPGRIRCEWGGVARNIAENMARLGADVQFITAVGDDEWGERLLENLKHLQINTDEVLVVPDQPTSSYVRLHHLDGEFWLGFDDMEIIRQITPGYLYQRRGLVKSADMVCIDANLSANALRTLFRLTRTYEAPVCVDPTAALLTHRLHPYLPEITVLTPDKLEAEALLGETLDNDEAIAQGAQRLVQLGVDLAVITLGAEGLYYATTEENGRVPAFPVDVVDATGVGDALTAAVAFCLLEDVSPGEAVRLGMAAAAQTLECDATVCPTINLEVLYDRLM